MKSLLIISALFTISLQVAADELSPQILNINEIGKKIYDEAYKSPKCSFTYFLTDKGKGEVLSQEAKTECAANAAFKSIGKPEYISHEAYNMWKDNQQLILLEKLVNK